MCSDEAFTAAIEMETRILFGFMRLTLCSGSFISTRRVQRSPPYQLVHSQVNAASASIHVPPLRQGVLAHSSTSVSHSGPRQPAVQLHAKASTESTQVALCRQGAETQSSMFVLQFAPAAK